MRRKQAHHRFAPMVGFALFLTILLLPAFAFADVMIHNHMQGGVATSTVGPQLYAYHQGTEESFDLEADFDLGVYDDTEVDGTGTLLQLAGATVGAWWDTDWGARRCFQITNIGAALTEHQVRLEFDSTMDMLDGLLQPNGEDYRAVAADDTTELDLYVDGGVGTSSTIVWVQLDVAGFGTTDFCLYFDNATAPSVSSEADVFTYTTPRRLYYPAYWRFDGSGGVNGTLDVVSYVDNNTISVGGATVVLNAGQTAPFSNVTEDTAILATGPIGGRGRGDGMDALVPISFAGTNMVFPTNRSNNRWTLVSPTGTAAVVEIYNGTTLQWTGTVTGTASTPVAEITGGNAGVIRSLGGVPIIATHTATNNSFSDSQVVPPFFGDDLWGVRSRNMLVGFDGGGSVDIWLDNGTITTVAGGAGTVSQLNNGADLDGNGTAMRFTNMITGTGGIQQADRDGWESTAFLPERLLDAEYWLPSAADYIAFACPTAMTISVGGTGFPCAPIAPGFPGHAVAGVSPQGTHIISDTGEPFFAYYEDSATQDETNLLGMKSAQAFSLFDLPVTGTATELLPPPPSVGTWTSPVIDTLATGTNVFGLLRADASLPAGTDVTMQVARGATAAAAATAPFVGPDGTAATTFGAGENPIPYTWDLGDAFYVVRVELTTTTPGTSPALDVLSLGHDLPEVSQNSVHVVETAGAAADRDWILRVWTEDASLSGAGATLTHLGSSGLTAAANASFDLDGSVQIIVAGGTVTQSTGPPVGVGPGLPHSVVVDTQGMNGVSADVLWQVQFPGTGVLIPHQLQLSFT